MGKRTPAHPFGGNPYGAPSLPFNIKMPDPFKGAKDFDEALGLKKRSAFDDIGEGFDQRNGEFGVQPKGRKRNRRRQFADERQERLMSGQEPLTPEEESNFLGNRDFFGNDRTVF